MELHTILAYAVALFSLFSVNVFLIIFLQNRKKYLLPPHQSNYEPLISVVIPAYNEGPYIQECINSVLSSDYPKEKLQILIIDDGSTDDTYKIAKEFEIYSCVEVYTKPNGGGKKASPLNFGIKRAKGELIATMDADSYLTKNTIRQMIPYFDDPHVMAVTPAVKIRQSNNWLKEFQRVEYMTILFSRKLLSFLDAVPVTPGPCSIFRSSVFEKIGGFDEKNLVEDQEIALRMQANHFRICSSLTAEVYTEPPDNLRDLIKQRVRWQRGGVRNYWNYRFLIKPEYGDFGMYYVPLNYASLIAFFLVTLLMINGLFFSPYYTKYIIFESFGLNLDLFTFIGSFVVVLTTVFTYISVKSFKNEKVSPFFILGFMAFYWYLMLMYNGITLIKELSQEKDAW